MEHEKWAPLEMRIVDLVRTDITAMQLDQDGHIQEAVSSLAAVVSLAVNAAKLQ